MTPQGHVDLEKLSLPDGISISKISGPIPERKYFPCKPAPPAEPEPKTGFPWSQPPPPSFGGAPAFSQSSFAGFPMAGSQFGGRGPMPPTFGGAGGGIEQSLNGGGVNPNVIVVDTNSLTTREEEERIRKEEEKGRSKKKKKKTAAEATPVPAPTSAAPAAKDWTPSNYGGYTPPAGGGGGGQVLIKSVNGKVVITPVPGTGSNPPLQSAAATPIVNGGRAMTMPQMTNGVVGNPPTPGIIQANQVDSVAVNGGEEGGKVGGGDDKAGEEDSSKKKNRKKRKNAEDKIEEINSIFAPRDGLDLSCEMDAADREIEQFKQFCFNSVPLQNRAKVNFDVKNIAFKKKN